MKLLIKNGNIVTYDKVIKGDLILENGVISAIGTFAETQADKVIDAQGKLVMPGLIDMHTHLREPGQEHKEDISTGAQAAAAGGFTTIACMPNTRPPIDNAALAAYVRYRSKDVGLTDIYPIGTITKGQKGEELAELRLMSDKGAVAFSDDGYPVFNAQTLRFALEYVKDFDGLIISHCEEPALSDGGYVHDGENAALAGLKGISAASEEVGTARDIIIAKTVGARIHIAHVSTRGALDIVRYYKSKGVDVTCETCPHYFAATDKEILNYNTNAKINPPLRTQDDANAILEGIIDGSIDALATDHAPHHFDEKNVEFSKAAFGSVGLESAVGINIKWLVDAGHIDFVKLAQLMSTNPAKILRLKDRGVIETGKRADITIIDPDIEYVFDTKDTYSKGKNSVFQGWKLKGKTLTTIVEGDIIYDKGQFFPRVK